MKKYYSFTLFAFLLLISCQSNEEDLDLVVDSTDDIVKEGFPIDVYTRSSCNAAELVERNDVTVKFYRTTNLFDFTERTLVSTSEGVDKYADLEEGSYYFEVTDSENNDVMKGIYRVPTDLIDGNKIGLSKGVKTGYAFSEVWFGDRIPNAEIIHTNEITQEQYISYSNEDGEVCIELDPGRYHFRVNHPDHISYDSEQGFNVFWTMYQDVNNFILEKRD